MADADQATVPVNQLEVGKPAPTALYDDDGVVVVGRGVLVTSVLVERLQHRGIHRLYTGASRARVARRASSDAVGRRRSDGKDPATPPIGDQAANEQTPGPPDDGLVPFCEPAPPEELSGYSPEKLRRLESLHAQSLRTVEHLAAAVRQRKPVELSDTDPVIEATIDELVDDPDPVVASTLRYQANLDLARRCVQFSALSLAVGMNMEISPRALRELGRAALLHDYGLFDLSPDARFPHFAMDDASRRAYREHPLTAERLMHAIDGATFTLGVLVAQVHELIDGSGFPRSLVGRSIHPLSRVLSVVDAYLALTSPPAGHRRVLPCDAVAYLISGVSRGLFAPSAVTGLLKTITLYPIGSVVELSDTTQVRVVRSRGQDYGYPVVQPLSAPAETFDLKASGLFVTRPIPSAEAGEVRLPQRYTEIRPAGAAAV